MKRLRQRLSRMFDKRTRSPTVTSAPDSSIVSSVGLTASSPVPSKSTTPRPLGHPATSLHEEILPALPVDAQISVENFKTACDDDLGGYTHGYLHLPSKTSVANTAILLLSGAGGGVVGPSAMYLSLAHRLPLAGLSVLRLDYRFPARIEPCIADAKTAMAYLTKNHDIDKFVLVGWSFGGAPVFSLAGRDERVIGVATVASQTADALRGAREAGARGVPALILHGTGDRTLSDRCSRNLHAAWLYGHKGSGLDSEEARLVLFDGDDHSLTQNVAEATKLIAGFAAECCGVQMDAVSL